MTTPAVRAWYAIMVSFIACVVIALAGVAYTNHVQDQADRRDRVARIESDRRWCNLLSNLDDAYGQAPPVTQTGRNVAGEIHRLRSLPPPAGFGCPG